MYPCYKRTKRFIITEKARNRKTAQWHHRGETYQLWAPTNCERWIEPPDWGSPWSPVNHTWREEIRQTQMGNKCLALIQQRSSTWKSMSPDECKLINTQISRASRNDYRDHVENILTDIEREGYVGNISEVYRLSKSLSTKRKLNAFIQPSADHHGNKITSTEQ